MVIFHMVSFVHAQNVGIGTTTPTEKLQVAGNVKADTVKPNALQLAPNAGNGKILTSDAAGNASWQTGNAGAGGDVGFGGWGDCSVQNISGFNPVVAVDGLPGDYFGRSVAISGNFAIVGAPLDNNGFLPDQGSAYIFYFNGINWVQQQKLLASDGTVNDMFGIAVSISGNYAVVGSYFDDNGANADQGSAYIFFYNGTTWVETQKILHVSGGPGDRFGESVCIKGNIVIIGAPYDDIGADAQQGSADVYGFNGTSWLLQERLVATDGLPDDNFGFSVTVEGNYAFVGAPNDDVDANVDQGSVYQFFYNGTNWVQQKRITNTLSQTAGDKFGWSVSLSYPYCVFGEPFSGLTNNTGAVFMYQFNAIAMDWLYHQTIAPVLLSGNVTTNAGMSVSISGDYFIVVTTGKVENMPDKEGKLFIYKNLSGLWQLYEDFVDPGGGPNEGFNLNTAIDNNRFVFGSPQAPLNVARGKVAFGKIN
jgi:hypothetical protein